MLGRFRRITSMADVASKIDGVIATDGTGFGCQGLGLSKHLPALLNDILSFPAHANDRSRAEEFAEGRVERLLRQILVVILSHFHCGPYHLQSNKLVPTLLKSGNNVTHKTTLNAIGLHSQESALLVRSSHTMYGKRIALDSRVAVLVSNRGSGGSNESKAREFGCYRGSGGAGSHGRGSTASAGPSCGCGGDGTSGSGEHD
mmetsp:Transcript_24951/g.42744  ORF Transcript_24951/g.42744 Transcript_24951/m.42744 type:complete len:202 (+) Transcript_24951:205-810(+)